MAAVASPTTCGPSSTSTGCPRRSLLVLAWPHLFSEHALWTSTFAEVSQCVCSLHHYFVCAD